MRSAVRLTARGRLASGVLTSEQLIDASLSAHLTGATCDPVTAQATHVITAAHFARHITHASVSSPLVNGVARDFYVVPGTDIAIGKLNAPAPLCELVPIAPRARLGQKVVSAGFSDQARVPAHSLVPRLVFSRVLGKLPWFATYDLRTRARHGAVLLPMGLQWARRGDSGGPILSSGELVGIQSMVVMPLGVPVGLAAINLLAPHLVAIKAAMSR